MPAFCRNLPPALLILTIGALVGVSFTLSKVVALAGVPPLTALYRQVLMASLILLALAVATGRRLPLTPHHLGYYFGAGILGVSGPALIGYSVLSHVSAGFYSALVTLSPLFTFTITAAVERRMLPLHRLIGILVGLVGISIATGTGFSLDGIAPIWIVSAMAGPLLLAFGNVFRSRAYPPKGDPIMMATGALLSQLVLIWPVHAFSQIGSAPSGIPFAPDAAILCVGIITAFSYILTFEVQRRTDGVGFAQVGYFATLSGIGMGALAFGEPLRPALFLSLAVIFLGLAISNGQIKRPILRAGILSQWLRGLRNGASAP
jgi:drug/metabolite transporter (DMT)-like permease